MAEVDSKPRCKIVGCDSPSKARGWCPKHYSRWHLHGDPLGGLFRHRNVGSCKADGCDDPAKALGFCPKHAWRWKRYGDPLGGGTPPRERGRDKSKDPDCKVDGCGNTSIHFGKWCQNHYKLWKAYGVFGLHPWVRPCKNCGEEFTAKRWRGGFCDSACSWAYRRRNYLGVLPQEERRALQRAKSKNYKACKYCGEMFMGRPGGSNKGVVYCSRACTNKDKREISQRRGCRLKFSNYAAGYCPDCSDAFGSKRWGVIGAISPQCDACHSLKKEEKKSRQMARRLAQEKVDAYRARYESLRSQYQSAISERACSECGIRFSVLFRPWTGLATKLGPRTDKTCGPDCAKKRAARLRREDRLLDKIRRRAREKAALTKVDPIKVLDRDGWQCYLCGVDTPKELRGTYEDNAPEIDHVVPLARGGSHTYENTRCACRLCNLDKSDSMPTQAMKSQQRDMFGAYRE